MKATNKCSALFLAVVFGMGIAACGNEAGKETMQTEEKEKTIEYGYRSEYKDLSGFEGYIQNAQLLGNVVYFIGSPGIYTGMPGQKLYKVENAQAQEIVMEHYDEGKSAAAFCTLEDENLAVVMETYGETTSYELTWISADGKTIKTEDITSLFEGEQGASVNNMAEDKQGNLYLSTGTNTYVLNKDGKHLFNAGEQIRVSDMICTPDGEVLLAVTEEGKINVKTVNLAEKKLGETYFSEDGWNMNFVKGQMKQISFYTGDEVCAFDKEGGTSSKNISFIANSINPGSIREVFEKENGDFIVLTTDMNYSEDGMPIAGNSQITELIKTDASALTPKEAICFGTYLISSDIAEDIVAFNKTSDKYRIEVKEYGSFSNPDKKASEEKLHMDIVTGKGPDIISLMDAGVADLYMSKNLLEDLTPWMEGDSEIGQEKYLNNVLDIYRKDSKLYGIVPSFYIRTVIGKKAILGEQESLTVEAVMKLAEDNPKAKKIFPDDISQSGMIADVLLPMSLNDYVNWETGECTFNSDSFIQLLEFANKYGGEEIDPQNYDYSQMNKVPEELRNGEQLLAITFINKVSDFKMYEEIFGEPISIIGYPVQEGCGSKIFPGSAFAINAMSKNSVKEGAWQFIRTYLLKDYQHNIGMRSGFPVMESALEKVYENAMTPEYYEDENGKQAEKMKFVDNFMGLPIEFGALKQEDIDKMDALVRKLNSTEKTDAEIEAIVLEEAAFYFGGQKTAAEAAEIIQNRAQIYVKENS